MDLKKIIAFILLILSSCCLQAQDMIFKKNQEQLLVKVVRVVDDSFIQYTMAGKSQDSLYTLPTTQIIEIIYADGRKDFFNQEDQSIALVEPTVQYNNVPINTVITPDTIKPVKVSLLLKIAHIALVFLDTPPAPSHSNWDYGYIHSYHNYSSQSNSLSRTYHTNHHYYHSSCHHTSFPTHHYTSPSFPHYQSFNNFCH